MITLFLAVPASADFRLERRLALAARRNVHARDLRGVGVGCGRFAVRVSRSPSRRHGTIPIHQDGHQLRGAGGQRACDGAAQGVGVGLVPQLVLLRQRPIHRPRAEPHRRIGGDSRWQRAADAPGRAARLTPRAAAFAPKTSPATCTREPAAARSGSSACAARLTRAPRAAASRSHHRRTGAGRHERRQYHHRGDERRRVGGDQRRRHPRARGRRPRGSTHVRRVRRGELRPGNARGGELSTSGGGVTAAVDPAARLSIDASASGGGVTSDLALTTRSFSRTSIRGDLNGGGSPLRLRTSGGGIRIAASEGR